MTWAAARRSDAAAGQAAAAGTGGAGTGAATAIRAAAIRAAALVVMLTASACSASGSAGAGSGPQDGGHQAGSQSANRAEPFRGGTARSDVYVTGYTWFDNTPPGSATISHPVVHRTAGGTGTWADPLTVAVGHTRTGAADILDVPAGTRLYLPYLRRYGVVEDTCGDGPSPQDGPCHQLSQAPSGAGLWIDIYVGGGPDDDEAAVHRCARRITDGGGQSLHQVVFRPPQGLTVAAGPLFSGGNCTSFFPGVPG